MEDIEHLFFNLDNIISDPLEEVENSVNINEPRKTKVYFRNDPLRENTENDFRMRYRFSKSVVLNVILPLIIDDLRSDTQRGLPISPVCQLLTALRFYATASFQMVCGDLLNISQSTVCHIVKKVSRALAVHLPDYVKFPNNLSNCLSK
ncbi:hypothetical protein OBRU01_18175 [Operophtera brumata]|uniref:Nuclease HARBI1 n=1 Tax=Operophtera brumata TaxID=104452 RepID=A0A0L7KZU1_OPEBR|nr:hypothetical protein OBRU01_18175 [Operophtera brumata]